MDVRVGAHPRLKSDLARGPKTCTTRDSCTAIIMVPQSQPFNLSREFERCKHQRFADYFLRLHFLLLSVGVSERSYQAVDSIEVCRALSDCRGQRRDRRHEFGNRDWASAFGIHRSRTVLVSKTNELWRSSCASWPILGDGASLSACKIQSVPACLTSSTSRKRHDRSIIATQPEAADELAVLLVPECEYSRGTIRITTNEYTSHLRILLNIRLVSKRRSVRRMNGENDAS